MSGNNPFSEPPPLPEQPSSQPSSSQRSDGNPYAAPTTEPAAVLSQREAFPEWDTKTLRKVYSDFATMRAMTIFWFVFGLLYSFAWLAAVMAVIDPDPEEPYLPFIFAACGSVGLLLLVCAVLNIRRSRAALPLSYVCSALLLPGIPVGTFLGIISLVAYRRSGKYAFGPDHLNFRDLKREYKRRRKLRID